MWLAPVQVAIIPIADRHLEHADRIGAELKAQGIRFNVDAAKERMGNKIRRAQLQKIPYMLVVGDREAEADAAAVRTRTGDDLGEIPVRELVDKFLAEIQDRS